MTKYYFEFNNYEYYGLVVSEANTYGEALQKSYQIYQSVIAGESIQDVMNEGRPTHISEKDAFVKFIQASKHEDLTVFELVDDFYSSVDTAVLVDYALV
ncbi:hypothetical protein D7X33_27540 [Butyricicoccus sp. 1XD8-22]|nr:hypothetical protein D7X33_27540 [Butyricicoccus sp. 1XD8-22]